MQKEVLEKRLQETTPILMNGDRNTNIFGNNAPFGTDFYQTMENKQEISEKGHRPRESVLTGVVMDMDIFGNEENKENKKNRNIGIAGLTSCVVGETTLKSNGRKDKIPFLSDIDGEAEFETWLN